MSYGESAKTAGWRSHQSRKAAARWAAWSRERLVKRLVYRLAKLQKGGEAATAETVDGEVERREYIARPALRCTVQQQRVAGRSRRRRNVALHAVFCPEATASDAEFKRAEQGPRLGSALAADVFQKGAAVIQVKDLEDFRAGLYRGSDAEENSTLPCHGQKIKPGREADDVAEEKQLDTLLKTLLGDNELQVETRLEDSSETGRLVDVDGLAKLVDERADGPPPSGNAFVGLAAAAEGFVAEGFAAASDAPELGMEASVEAAAELAAVALVPDKQVAVALKKGKGTGTVKQNVVHLASSEDEQHEYGSKEWASWIAGEIGRRNLEDLQTFLSAQLHRQVQGEHEYEIIRSALEQGSNEGKWDWKTSAKYEDIIC